MRSPVESPCPALWAQSQVKALHISEPSGYAEITHPFHSFRGQHFKILKIRKVSGRQTLVLQGGSWGTFAVPVEWTDQDLGFKPDIQQKGDLILDFQGLLALDDLLNNIISYAYKDEEVHHIELKVEISDNRLTLVIADDGVPFNPFGTDDPDITLSLEERPIGGLGIHLVRNIMDEMDYHRHTDKNVVTLVKYLNEAD